MMNKRERREQYLSTRRPAEYLQKRAETNAMLKERREKFGEAYKLLDQAKTVQERFDIMCEHGMLDRNNLPDNIIAALNEEGIKR